MVLEVPHQVRDGLPVVCSVSGGKDSTALMLALREASIPFRAVFADTGWEAQETYDHLDTLRRVLAIEIDVVRPKRDMVEAIRHRAGFPSRMVRWCTTELKVHPLRAYHDSIGDDTISAVGIRAEESESRSRMVEWEDDHEWGGWVWRPILRWSIDDVIAIHHRHSVPFHPLYLAGFERVGCWPCIFSQKEEIRMIAERDPERIRVIAQLEQEATAERARRNAETPGRYAHEQASFFLTRDPGRGGAMTINQIVDWARTSRGGRQLSLLPEPPSGGCLRWGMCEKGRA